MKYSFMTISNKLFARLISVKDIGIWIRFRHAFLNLDPNFLNLQVLQQDKKHVSLTFVSSNFPDDIYKF